MYTTKEVAIMLNITERTVRYYDNEQVVEASIRKNTRRYYDRDKVTELFVVLFLKNLGYSLSKIKEEMAQTDTIQALFSYAIEYKEFKISEDINMIKNVKALMRYYTKNNVSSIQDMSRLEQSKSDKLEQHLSPDELNIVRNISKIQETYQIGSAWPALIEKIKITHDYRGHVDEWFRLLDISFQGRWDVVIKLWQLEEKYQLNFSELIDENIKKNMRVFLYKKLQSEGIHVHD